MALGKIYWDQEDWAEVDKVLTRGRDFMSDRDSWLLNVAHVLFIRGKSYSEAAGFYEIVMRKFAHSVIMELIDQIRSFGCKLLNFI
jgi:tetratricopeptide repeat protein 30